MLHVPVLPSTIILDPTPGIPNAHCCELRPAFENLGHAEGGGPRDRLRVAELHNLVIILAHDFGRAYFGEARQSLDTDSLMGGGEMGERIRLSGSHTARNSV